jgi:hypothetical protein
LNKIAKVNGKGGAGVEAPLENISGAGGAVKRLDRIALVF